MGGSTIDLAEALAQLSALTIFELRGEWRRLHRAPPPMRLSRDLLIRRITYKLQERACGALPRRPYDSWSRPAAVRPAAAQPNPRSQSR